MVFITNPTNPPNKGAYNVPYLQSQFPPNPTPTQLERSTPSYIQFIDPIDIPPNLA